MSEKNLAAPRSWGNVCAKCQTRVGARVVSGVAECSCGLLSRPVVGARALADREDETLRGEQKPARVLYEGAAVLGGDGELALYLQERFGLRKRERGDGKSMHVRVLLVSDAAEVPR